MTVHYIIRSDSLYLAYLPKGGNSDMWIWDGHYRTKKDFNKKYEGYTMKEIHD